MRRSLFLLDSPVCPKDTLGGVEWSPTAGGSKDIKPCPNGALGMLRRKLITVVTSDSAF